MKSRLASFSVIGLTTLIGLSFFNIFHNISLFKKYSAIGGGASIVSRGGATTTSAAVHVVPVERKFPASALPDKVFTVIGLESSGTTFLSETIHRSLGLSTAISAAHYETIGAGFTSKYHNNQKQKKYWTEVQHVSLPWGGLTCRDDPNDNVVPVLFPATCTKLMRDRMRQLRVAGREDREILENMGPFTMDFIKRQWYWKSPIPKDEMMPFLEECESFTENVWTYPTRYSLNISSHLEWYQSHGVDIHVIIIMRDSTISRQSRQSHCGNSTIMAMEEELGRKIFQQAIQQNIKVSPPDNHQMGFDRLRHRLFQASPNNKVHLVSYELLNQLEGDYLQMIYTALGIDSNYDPLWRDGNVKHVSVSSGQSRPSPVDRRTRQPPRPSNHMEDSGHVYTAVGIDSNSAPPWNDGDVNVSLGQSWPSLSLVDKRTRQQPQQPLNRIESSLVDTSLTQRRQRPLKSVAESKPLNRIENSLMDTRLPQRRQQPLKSAAESKPLNRIENSLVTRQQHRQPLNRIAESTPLNRIENSLVTRQQHRQPLNRIAESKPLNRIENSLVMRQQPQQPLNRIAESKPLNRIENSLVTRQQPQQPLNRIAESKPLNRIENSLMDTRMRQQSQEPLNRIDESNLGKH